MEKREVTIGQATYEVGRFFVGTQPAAELVLDRLLHAVVVAEPVFDVRLGDAVYSEQWVGLLQGGSNENRKISTGLCLSASIQ